MGVPRRERGARAVLPGLRPGFGHALRADGRRPAAARPDAVTVALRATLDGPRLTARARRATPDRPRSTAALGATTVPTDHRERPQPHLERTTSRSTPEKGLAVPSLSSFVRWNNPGANFEAPTRSRRVSRRRERLRRTQIDDPRSHACGDLLDIDRPTLGHFHDEGEGRVGRHPQVALVQPLGTPTPENWRPPTPGARCCGSPACRRASPRRRPTDSQGSGTRSLHAEAQAQVPMFSDDPQQMLIAESPAAERTRRSRPERHPTWIALHASRSCGARQIHPV